MHSISADDLQVIERKLDFFVLYHPDLHCGEQGNLLALNAKGPNLIRLLRKSPKFDQILVKRQIATISSICAGIESIRFLCDTALKNKK